MTFDEWVLAVKAEFPERWISKIQVDPNGCWIWTAARDGQGYGATKVKGRMVGAHRAIYEHLVGRIPEGLHCDHLCRVRICVNPSHIEIVSCQENVLRGVGHSAQNARKTRCLHGHVFDSDRSDGKRSCKTCNAKHARNHRRRKMEERIIMTESANCWPPL